MLSYDLSLFSIPAVAAVFARWRTTEKGRPPFRKWCVSGHLLSGCGVREEKKRMDSQTSTPLKKNLPSNTFYASERLTTPSFGFHCIHVLTLLLSEVRSALVFKGELCLERKEKQSCVWASLGQGSGCRSLWESSATRGQGSGVWGDGS